MAKEKAPAMPFYIREFWADENVKLMSWAARGFYVDLLCLCWTEGSIPASEEDLYLLFRSHADPGMDGEKHFQKLWVRISKLFIKNDERLTSAKVETLRKKKNEYREKQKGFGRVGAKKRWGDDGVAHAMPIATPSRKNSFPISDFYTTPISPSGDNKTLPIKLLAAFGRCVDLHPNADPDASMHALISMVGVGRVTEADADLMEPGMRRWLRSELWAPGQGKYHPEWKKLSVWLREKAWLAKPKPSAEAEAAEETEKRVYASAPADWRGLSS